jgi:hypothetical protein
VGYLACRELGLFVQLTPAKAGWARDSSSVSIPKSAIEQLGLFGTFDLTRLGLFLQLAGGY